MWGPSGEHPGSLGNPKPREPGQEGCCFLILRQEAAGFFLMTNSSWPVTGSGEGVLQCQVALSPHPGPSLLLGFSLGRGSCYREFSPHSLCLLVAPELMGVQAQGTRKGGTALDFYGAAVCHPALSVPIFLSWLISFPRR